MKTLHAYKSSTPALTAALLFCCCTALNAQQVRNIADYVISDNMTLTLGSGASNIPYTAGDTWNVSGTFTTGTINVGSGATLASVYISGNQSFSFVGTGVTSTGMLAIGGDNIGARLFNGVIDLTRLTTNSFASVGIYSGALRISSAAQLGTRLANFKFLGTPATNSGTLVIAAGSNLVFDSGGGETNRFMMASGMAGTFLLEAGASLTLSGNRQIGAAASQGAAIQVLTGGSLIFAAEDGAQYIFKDNVVGLGSSGSNNNSRGSVIYAIDSYLEINNALFQSNTSFSGNDNASAIFNSGAGSITKITNSIFRDNATCGGGNAGAIGALNGNMLILDNVLFERNYANTGNGGAITINTGTASIFRSTFLGNYSGGTNGGGVFLVNSNSTRITIVDSLFQNNYSTGATNPQGGGVLSTNNVTHLYVTASNSLFISNSTNGNGGIIAFTGASQSNSGFILISSTVKYNASLITGQNGGGVMFTNHNSGTFSATDTLFEGNYARWDGGVLTTNQANNFRLDLNRVLFVSNTAGNYGGAINVHFNQTSNAGAMTLTDVSFIDNTAGVAGGAFHVTGGNLAYTVTAATSSTVAGNTAAGASSGFTVASGAASTTLNGTFTVNIGADGTLYMYDPIKATTPSSYTYAVSKTGAGLWVLGDANVFTLGTNSTHGNNNFTVTSGTLHLVGSNKAFYKGSPIAAGSISITTNTGTFALRAAATLSIGGGNTITAPVINLENNATIALDMLGATVVGTGYTLLTLTTPNLTSNWNQNINFLNIDTLIPADGSLYNLITLTNGAIPEYSIDTLILNGLPNDYYRLRISADGKTLQLYYSTIADPRYVITWIGANPDGLGNWRGAGNWVAATDNVTGTTFGRGDIINLADTTTLASTTINIDTLGNATITALNVSGTADYTITGTRAIVADATAGSFAGGAAVATGQLVLGAQARSDGTQTDQAAYQGTLTLSNTYNEFRGGILVHTGALVGNHRTLASGTPGIDIRAAGTVTFNQAAPGAYASPIKGTGNLVKTNTAALTLTANSASFAGTTAINEGAILLDTGAALGGAINVATGARLGGAGAAGGAVTLADGSTLQIGLGTIGGQTLTIGGNLTATGASILDYTHITNTLLVNGNINLATSSTIKFTTAATGSFALVNVTGGLAAINTNLFDIVYRGKLLTADEYTLTTTGGQLWLTLEYIPLGLNNVISWNGAAADGLWLTSTNWNAYGQTTDFAQGDIIALKDSGYPAAPDITPPVTPDPVDPEDPTDPTEPPAHHAIQLDAPATIAAMYASGTESYVISGDGSLTIDKNAGELSTDAAATGKLILGKTTDDSTISATTAAYTGTLSLLNTGSNNFTGGIEIHTGALRVAGNDQLGIPTLNHREIDLVASTTTLVSNLAFTGTGALIVAAGGNLTLDDNYDGLNTLTIGVNSSTTHHVTIIAEPGATFGINRNAGPTGDGGAIRVNPLSTLILTGTANGDGGALLFVSNSSATRGGVISVTASAALYLDSATFAYNTTGTGAQNGGAIIVNNSGTAIIRDTVFYANTAGSLEGGNNQGNGGAVAGMNGAYIELHNVLFASNTGYGLGGALFNNTQNAQTFVHSSTFTDNISTNNNGGAFAQQYGVARNYATIDDTLFTSNTALTGQGGAYWIAQNNTGTVTNSTFTNNYAASHGGAISVSANGGILTVLDSLIYDNTSAAGVGGAIYLTGNNSILTLGATEGNTTRIAGNTASGISNSIYITANTGITLNIDVARDGSLEMLDPIQISLGNNMTTLVTKTGAGTWKLGGSSTFFNTSGVSTSTAIADLTIAEGTLHLYGAGETTHNGIPVEAGKLLHTGDQPRGLLYLTVKNGATLSAGPGASITANRITIEPDATIAFDLFRIQPGSTDNLLTISLSGGSTQLNNNGWTQYLDLGDLNAKLPELGTYNLFYRATNNTFTDINSFRLVNALPDGYSLQISSNGRTLQLVCDTISPKNSLLTWTGSASTGNWLGTNWESNFTLGQDWGTTFNYFRQGDIVNIIDVNGTIDLNSGVDLIVAGMYVSGSENITLTGAALAGDATAGLLSSSNYAGVLDSAAALTGKLILGKTASGAYSSDGDDENDTDGGTFYTITLADAEFTGTLTLANASNNFAAGIEIHSGALAGNADTLGAGDTGITNHGTLIIDQTTAASYAGLITGTGNLVKTGKGSLTLAGNVTTLTGAIDILEGSLLLADGVTLGAGITPAQIQIPTAASFDDAGTAAKIHVSTAAGFGGAGTANASVILEDNAFIQVGIDPFNPETLLINGDLLLGDTFLLDYANAESKLNVSGITTHDGNGTGTINFSSFQSGTFVLGNIASLYDCLQVTVDGIIQYSDARQNASLHTEGDNLLLIGTGDYSRELTWTGTTNGIWQLTGADWAGSGTTGVFGTGDRVFFTDAADVATREVTVSQNGVTASDMHVQGASNYTFTGGGITTDNASIFSGAEIAGGEGCSKLFKEGTGTLTLANNGNQFRGGIDLNEGVLAISGTTTASAVAVTGTDNTALYMAGRGLLVAGTLHLVAGSTIGSINTGNDTVIVTATQGTFISSGAVIGNGAIRFDDLTTEGTVYAHVTSATLYASATSSGTVTVTGTTITPNTLTLTGHFTRDATLPDNIIIKTGNGILQYSATLTGNGITKLDEGAVRLTGFTAASSTLATHEIILNGGTLAFVGSGAVNDLTASNWTGITLTQGENAATTTISGVNDNIYPAAGEFKPILTGGINVIVNSGAGSSIVLTSTASTHDFSGIVRLDSGALHVTDYRQLGSSLSVGSADKIIFNGGELHITGSGVSSGRGFEMRSAEARVFVAEGITTTWGDINRTVATTPYAHFIKFGLGTIIFTTSTISTTKITVEEGRIRITNINGAIGDILINPAAVFEMNAATSLDSARGHFGGKVYRPSLNGVTPASLSGAGTFELNGGHANFTSPFTTIENIKITGTNSSLLYTSNRLDSDFSPHGTITIDQGALVLGANSQNMGDITLKNGGALGFLMHGTQPNVEDPSTFSTGAQAFKTGRIKSLTNTSDTPANLYFNVNIALGRGDQLIVETPISGAFNVGVYNYSNDLPKQYHAAIDLLRAPDSGNATLTLITPSVISNGLYNYVITATTTSGVTSIRVSGTGAMSNTASFINSTAAALPQSWFSELDSVTQRLGELHFDNNRAEKSGISAWIRGYAQKLDYNNKLTDSEFGETHYATQAGFDLKVAGTPWNIYLGLYMGCGSARRDYTAAGDARSDSLSGGLYLTINTPDGWYVDATTKINRFKNSFTAISPTGDRATADYNNSAIGGSIEIGKHHDVGYGTFFEPQIQGAITSIAGSSYTTDNGVSVNLFPGATYRARAGFRLGRSIEIGATNRLSIYLKGYYSKQWTKNGRIYAATTGGQNARYSPKVEGDSLTGGAGAAWRFTRRTQVYLDFETTQHDYYIKPWNVNLGIRHLW